MFYFVLLFQEACDKKLAAWQSDNERLTRESCTYLLKKLKKEHLDPVLARLHGAEGAKVMFEDIIAGYNRIEQDYKARATGAKDTCAAVFFEFHPVHKRLTCKEGTLARKRSDSKVAGLTAFSVCFKFGMFGGGREGLGRRGLLI